jgi:hypothetical protein
MQTPLTITHVSHMSIKHDAWPLGHSSNVMADNRDGNGSDLGRVEQLLIRQQRGCW